MNDKELYHQLLGLKRPWGVDHVDLDVAGERVDVHVVPQAGFRFKCPECGQKCPLYDQREERHWRHLDSCGFLTYLVARIPRVECPQHGKVSVSVPWSEPHSRFTLLFAGFALRVLQATKVQKKTAQLLRLNPGQVHDLMKSAVERGLDRREEVVVEHLSLDEKSMARGHTYLTVLGDNQGKRVLDVEEGRDTKATCGLLGSLSEEQRAGVKSVTMDMWSAFMKACHEVLPQAQIVHDRYHIAAYLNGAVDKTRRHEHRLLAQEMDSPLTRTKYLWLKNPENLSEKQAIWFEELLREDLVTADVWALKENFRRFFECSTVAQGEKFFEQWHSRATALQNRYLDDVANMLKRHLKGLLAYLRHRITNAFAEQMNGQIQLIKANARGYRTFKNFRIAILFFLGKLDMNPQKNS